MRWSEIDYAWDDLVRPTVWHFMSARSNIIINGPEVSEFQRTQFTSFLEPKAPKCRSQGANLSNAIHLKNRIDFNRWGVFFFIVHEMALFPPINGFVNCSPIHVHCTKSLVKEKWRKQCFLSPFDAPHRNCEVMHVIWTQVLAANFPLGTKNE